MRVPDAEKTFRAMLNQHVLIKNVSASHPLLQNCLRLTIGTPEENQIMLQALEQSL